MPQSLIDTKKSKLLVIWINEEIEIPNSNGFVNNKISEKAVKEIIEIAHKEEIESMRQAQMIKFQDAK